MASNAAFELWLQMPVDFARSTFAFAKELLPTNKTSIATTIDLENRVMEQLVSTPGDSVLVKSSIKLNSSRFSMHVLDEDIKDRSLHVFHVDASKVVLLLDAIKSSNSLVRFLVSRKRDRIRIAVGHQTAIPSIAPPIAPGNINGLKRRLEEDPTRYRWESTTYAELSKVEVQGESFDLPERPPDRIIFRVDAVYFLRKLTSALKAVKDKAQVKLSFDGHPCKRHPITHEVVWAHGKAVKAPRAEAARAHQEGLGEDIDEHIREEREARKAARLDEPEEDALTEPYDSWQPTAVRWTYSGAGTDFEINDIFPIRDRCYEYSRRGESLPASAAGEKIIGWQLGDEIENPLGTRTDRALGIDNRDSSTAELFSFPRERITAPPDYYYVVRHLALVSKGAVFSRHSTFHLTEEAGNPLEGALWVCFPYGDESEQLSGGAGAMHAIVSRAVTK